MGPGTRRRWVLAPDLTAPSRARRHLEDAVAGLPDDTVDVARLLVSELVANAVLHGRGQVLLVVDGDDRGVRVEVHDDGAELPVLADVEPLMEHGTGLRLVDTMASRWGVERHEAGRAGKHVWFVLG